MIRIKPLALICSLFISVMAFAQNQGDVKAVLIDATTGDPVPFATTSLTKTGQSKPTKYVLSSESGVVSIEKVRNGEYAFKAELLGYKPFEKTIKIEGKVVDLGEVRLELDAEILESAGVSAVGNPVIIKKDTIEYNASSFKTTENDMLEDLLKKLPGVEIDDDGSVTVNGETITKITIDGKTFFLDDPQVAQKNLPAKLINKLKVIKKKSEQAEFTGIDDGEEENVIDLSVKPGMMNGIIGNLQAGVGHDVPSDNNTMNDTRFAGNGFLGKFTSKANVSLILNANNTNNQAATDRSGNMMMGMMGGGGMGGGMMMGGGGISTSYMAGLNAAADLCDDRMELGGNYMFNRNNRVSSSDQYQETKYEDYTSISNTRAENTNLSMGHNFGVRLEHEFSENTSIVFQPQFNFGTGSYAQKQQATTEYDPISGSRHKVNESVSDNGGDNKNFSTSGMFIFRQRLGIPGRTLTAQVRYSFSNNETDGYNKSTTTSYQGENKMVQDINQTFNQTQKSSQVSGRATYTEPMGDYFYLEANYSYNWNKSVSDKQTYDMNKGGALDLAYTNNVVNETRRQEFGGNVLFQKPTFRAQIGFSAIPTHTINTTTNGGVAVDPIDDKRWNFAPQARVDADINDNANIRVFYRGQSNQPQTSQLMPVPDITNPLQISFGNPHLTPYFNHNANAEYRFSNRQAFSSFTVRINGSLTQNPISSVSWQGSNGARYSMPFNGKNTGSAGINTFFNTPIAKSNFSINNQLSANWSKSSSYLANKVDMSIYPDPMTDYYDFMEEFYEDHKNLDDCDDFTAYDTHSISVNERLRMSYRSDAIEITLGGSTRMNKTLYTIDSMQGTTRWTNRVEGSFLWTWDAPGITLSTDANYRWYIGTEQKPVLTWNAEITKLLFKKQATLSLRAYDILGQQNNFSISDTQNMHTETLSNTLGRYIILSFTWRFGSFGRGGGMFGGGRPPMGGPGMGGPGMGGRGMGGGRPRF